MLDLTRQNAELQNNLSAVAHLIHGSSEGRFTITYCPGHIGREAIESVNFAYGDLGAMMQRYSPKTLKMGYNTVGDEKIFFIPNPGMGLWAWKERIKN